MLVQISSGMGPVECELAVKKMLQYFIKHNDVNVLEIHESRFSDGYTSVLFETEDDLSEYNGTVQWIFQSPVRKGHKRKNWFINVSILDETEEFVYENNDVYFELFHCGGNGGQNVNKVETGVRATHIGTGITVTSTKERSQLLNKKDCVRKIKLILEQRKQQSVAHQKNDAWKEHNNLIRGNPVKTFKE